MSSRLVKQQLAAFLAASGGVRKQSQKQQKKVTGEEGKVDKESGKSQQKKLNRPTVPNSEAAKKRRKRKEKKGTQNLPTESVRERNLRLLHTGAQPNPELEDLLAKVTGVASAKSRTEDEEESDFDDLDY